MKNKKNYIYGLIIVVLFSLILLYTLSNMRSQGFNFINAYTVKSGDDIELYNPSDNFVKNGCYSLDNETYYTDRIPGIAILYIPLRYFFEHKTCVTILTITALFTYLFLILLFFNKFSKRIGHIKAFILSIVIVFLTPFHYFPLTVPESHSLIFTIIGFLTLFRKNETKNFNKYLISGVFFMMASTFRGFLIPSVLSIALILFLYFISQKKIRKAFLKSIIFTAPLLIYFISWSTFNYCANSSVFPLQTNNRNYKSDFKHSTHVTKTTFKMMGFETLEWYPNSPMYYLMGKDSVPPTNLYNNAKPFGIEKIYIDSLRLLTTMSYEIDNNSIESSIISLNNQMRKSIKSNSSIFQTVISIPIKNFFRSFTFNFTSNWGLPAWNKANAFEKAYRLFLYFLFHLTFSISILFSAWSILKKETLFVSILWLVWCGSMFFTYTFILNQIEFKYYFSLFPMSPIIIGVLYNAHLNSKTKKLSTNSKLHN